MAGRPEILMEMIAQGFRRDRISKFQTDKIVVCVTAKMFDGTLLKDAVKLCLREARESGAIPP